MRKTKQLLIFSLILILTAAIITGCANQGARKLPPPYNNNPIDNVQTRDNNLQNQMNNNAPIQGNDMIGDNNIAKNGGQTGNNMTEQANRISSTFEMVDISFAQINVPSLNVRSFAGTKYPVIGKVNSGQKIRVIGKMDDWYVVQVPNSSKIGCIPKNNVTPYPAKGATNPTQTSAPQKPIPQTPVAGTGTMSADERTILDLCNKARAEAGLKPLKASADLTKLARMKSQDMANKNYFSHQSPTYGSPFDMLKNHGVNYMYAGENIAMNVSAEAAFNAWMNSEGHRKNILNPNFTELGVGISPSNTRSNLYTQLFIGR